MITFYCFGKINPMVIGETRDLRVEWALEETELPYKVHGVDHTGGEHLMAEFREKSPFCLLPVIEDDGFKIAESGAILLYLAEKSGKLIPQDLKGRARVMQWCFATLNTVEPPMLEWIVLHKFGGEKDKPRKEEMVKRATRWLEGLEPQLKDREWIAGEEFSIADILLNTVLRQIRKAELLDKYPEVKAYHTRSLDRPAWQRTVTSYSKRLGVTPESIR